MSNGNGEFDEQAYRIAWDWFRVHADQRMDLFRFYVLISAAIGAGYGGAFQTGQSSLAAVIAALGAFIALLFALLDHRVKSLLKLAEAVLKHEQRKLSVAVGYDDIKIAENADTMAERQLSYTKLFRAMYLVVVLVFFAGAFHALKQGPEPSKEVPGQQPEPINSIEPPSQ